MVISRLTVLMAMFFLVALSPRPGMALSVFACGVIVYSALWCCDIFKGKRRG